MTKEATFALILTALGATSGCTAVFGLDDLSVDTSGGAIPTTTSGMSSSGVGLGGGGPGGGGSGGTSPGGGGTGNIGGGGTGGTGGG